MFYYTTGCWNCHWQYNMINNNNKIISKLPLLLPSFDDTNYIQQEQNDKFSINWLINIVTLKFFVTILMNQYLLFYRWSNLNIRKSWNPECFVFRQELHLYWLLLWSLNCKRHAGTGIFWQESNEVMVW